MKQEGLHKKKKDIDILYICAYTVYIDIYRVCTYIQFVTARVCERSL